MQHVISAPRGDETLLDTRASPASAVVLAMKWLFNGYKDVQIVGSNGRVHDVNLAQQRLRRSLRL